MADIYVHGGKIESVFELLGKKENDITYSIGWALANCPNFLKRFTNKLVPGAPYSEDVRIQLQTFKAEAGITDIEIVSRDSHIIIEAKRGWTVPANWQLSLYAKRLVTSGSNHRVIVSMSESSQVYAALHLPNSIQGIPVKHLSWKDIDKLAQRLPEASHAEKRLLGELRTYLRRIVNMQDQRSNLVYVVSLGSGVPEGCSISWVDIIEKRQRYFHPLRGGWPSNPPNYLGFRYGGKLQRIHHVESWKVVDDLHSEIPGIGKGFGSGPHLCYVLGPAIIPTKDVKSGKVYPSGRVWAMLDLLLTCDTVAEARDETNKRQSGND